MRGKESDLDAALQAVGITPACAGKRVAFSLLRVAFRDHPRVCGEKGFAPGFTPKTDGSPPRVRGKVPLKLVSGAFKRITPACAGKS